MTCLQGTLLLLKTDLEIDFLDQAFCKSISIWSNKDSQIPFQSENHWGILWKQVPYSNSQIVALISSSESICLNTSLFESILHSESFIVESAHWFHLFINLNRYQEDLVLEQIKYSC